MAKLNGLEHVGETMMRSYLQRLEDSGIIMHTIENHPSRGRTNVYFAPDHDIEELKTALRNLGITLPGKGGFDEAFGSSK